MSDILNPQISVVARGLEGKVITIYGGNNLGKTLQASKLSRPLFMPLEKGLNNLSGVKYVKTNSWAEFLKHCKDLVKLNEKVRELYDTIVIDSLDAFAKYANRYVCNKYGVQRLKDGNDGYGLWTEYATEVWEAVDRLVGLGLTIVFIAHAEEDKSGKFYPKGDKRTISPILDNSDIVMFLYSNGVDEEGNVIKSSGGLAETQHYFARARNPYTATFLPEFTAENLDKLVADAVAKQEEAEGITAVSYDEQAKEQTSEDINFDELKANVVDLLNALVEKGVEFQSLQELIEKHLGLGKQIQDVRPIQLEALSVLFGDLQDVAEQVE